MIISSKNDLLKEIDSMLNSHSIRNITLLYPHINANLTYMQSPQNLEQKILSKLRHIKHNTTIHSFESQILQQPHIHSKHIIIKTYYNNAIIQSLLDSIKESTNTTKSYQNLNAMLDDIKLENIDKISFSKSKDLILEHIEKIFIESNLFAETLKADAKANITQLFNELECYIKQALEDRDKDSCKNIIKAIFGVIVSIALGGGAVIVLLGIGATLFSSLISYQIAKDNKYSYIKNPIIEFLATELAAYIQLINTQLLSCMLIVESIQEKGKKKIEFLDFSGFNPHLENTPLSCSQSIAFKGEFMLDESKANILDIPSLLNKQATALPTIKPSSIKSQMLHIRQDNIQDNIKDTPLLTGILKETQHFNHFSYVESPHFNSALLAEIFANKNKNYPNTHSTNMAKNYLIITNAPSKYNAKLTETITQYIIGNEIKDDINNRSKQELIIKSKGKKSNYNTTRDYSTYRIEINKNDDEPYMVQLSPFVRVEIEAIKQSYENNENYKNLLDSTQLAYLMDRATNPCDLFPQDTTFYQATQDMIDSFVRTYGIEYIQSFFKTPKEIEDIITKEKQTAKDFLNQIHYFYDENLDNSLLSIFMLFYGLCVFRINFPSFVLKSEIIKGKLHLMCLNETWEFKLTKSQTIQIAQSLQKALLQTKDLQDTEISKDFLAYLKEFINTNNSEVKAYDDEIKQTIGIDLDKALALESSQIKRYGAKYIEILHQERTQEVFYSLMFKALGLISPFMNFANEDMIYATKHCLVIFVNTLENLNKSQKIKYALYKTLFTEIGGVLFLSYPTTIRVHIEVNGGVEKTAKNLNSNIDITNKIKAKITELSKLNNKSHIQDFLKGFAQVELRRTKEQLALFEAKTAFILDSIDKNARELNLQAIKEKLKESIKAPKDIALIDRIIFTYNGSKAQSHFIGTIQAREIFTQIKRFRYNKIIYTFKANVITFAIDTALDIALNHYFSTKYEAYQREFESIMHKRYSFYYDLPYALKRKESLLELNATNQTIKKDKEITYYPMIVCSKFLSFDLKSMIYGTELCTGGLTHHIGLAYLLEQNKSDDIQEFLLKKLLAYLIIDEKREARVMQDYEIHYNKQVPDYTFFNHKSIDSNGNIIDKVTTISLDNIHKYKVPKDSSLYKDFKALEEDDDVSAIDAYNEALEILADYKDYYFANTRSGKSDRNKARRLLQCLNIIGQNNIRALYVGTSENSKWKKRPKLIGRLATTIIVEDGLWLG